VKPDVLLIGPIIPHAMAQLEAAYALHRYDLAADKDALIAALAPRLTAIATRGDYPLPGALMKRLPNVKVIASSGTGYDGVDVAAARALGIAITNSPGAASECVADAAWALILATVRRTVFNDKYVRAGGWLKAPVPFTDNVWGERLGILGLGAIGKAIARRAEGFRMDVAYHGRQRQPDVAYPYYPSPVELARDAKILVVAMPGGNATRGFVNRDVIDALGPDGYLVNISRGSNVDEPYLVDALVNQRLAGAGLDVFADEPRIPEALFGLDHVVLQPHASSGTHATRNALGQFVVDNLAAHFAGKPLVSPV
jgi:lactate dehydrogenase-like 2-hydroxyacid dehydrogenase